MARLPFAWSRVWASVGWLAILGAFAAPFAVTLLALRPEIPRKHWIIPPGRERAALAFVGPEGREVAGARLVEPVVRGSLLVLAFEGAAGCAAAPFPPPGGLLVGPPEALPASAPRKPFGAFAIAWASCGSPTARELDAGVAQLAGVLAIRSPDGVWSVTGGHASAGVGGLLSPFAERVGGWNATALALAAVLTLATALGLAGAARVSGSAPPAANGPRPWGRSLSLSPGVRRGALVVAAVLALAGVGARVHAAATLPLDEDETWALPSDRPVASPDHDAWVHPPMHRALQRVWVRTTGWTEGDSLLRLRALSLAASLASLGVLLGALARGGAAPGILAAAPLLLSTAVAGDQVLARPYGLAVLAFTVTIVLVSPGYGRRALFAAALATIAAAWLDLPTGVAACAVVGLALAREVSRRAPGSRRALALVTLGVALGVAPLVPGALQAAREQVTPTARDGRAAPDLSPVTRAGRGRTIAAAADAVGFAVGAGGRRTVGVEATLLGAVLVVAASLTHLKHRERATAAVLPALLVLAVALGHLVALRSRNVAFLAPALAWIAALALAACVEPEPP